MKIVAQSIYAMTKKSSSKRKIVQKIRDIEASEETRLLTGGSVTRESPVVEEGLNRKELVEGINDRSLPVHITDYVLVPGDSRQFGNVDHWAGDLVGRWLSEKGVLKASGWAVDEGAGQPARRVFLVHEQVIVAASYIDRSRPDLVKAKSNDKLEYCGWTLEVEGKLLPYGDVTLEVYALLQSGESVKKLGGRTIRVSPMSSGKPLRDGVMERIIARRLEQDAAAGKWPKMNVDEAYIIQNRLHVKGWAVSPPGIHKVKVYINDTFLGLCFYGLQRPDVKQMFPMLRDSFKSGFALNSNQGPYGDPKISIKVAVQDTSGRYSDMNLQI